jgi:chromosome segregation ATPase
MTVSKSKFIALPFVGASLVVMAACASGPVNTSNPATSDLLFRQGALNTHLDSRRQVLDGLQAELKAVSATLSLQLRELGNARSDVIRLREERRASDAELTALESELTSLDQSAAASREKLTRLQSKKQQLEAAQSSPGAAQSGSDAEALKQEITQLEAEIAVLERGIKRTIETRRQYALRSE